MPNFTAFLLVMVVTEIAMILSFLLFIIILIAYENLRVSMEHQRMHSLCTTVWYAL